MRVVAAKQIAPAKLERLSRSISVITKSASASLSSMVSFSQTNPHSGHSMAASDGGVWDGQSLSALPVMLVPVEVDVLFQGTVHQVAVPKSRTTQSVLMTPDAP